jgi:hypothetical protein
MREIRASDRVSPQMYARLFVSSAEGPLILEALIERFHRNPYVPGGIEGQRQTDFNAGCMNVMSFILGQIDKASTGEDDDDVHD